MTRTLQAAAMAFGLVFLSTPSMAFMHGMAGMGELGMYTLTVGGLTARNDAKGIDEKFRRMNGVERVHVDVQKGEIMIWMKEGETLDEALATKIVTEAGFELDDFERPE